MDLLKRAWQGVLNSVAEGVIALIDDSGPVQKAQLTIGHLERRDNTPVLYHYGFTAHPPIGTRACLNFTSGDRTLGVVIGTNDGQSRPRNLGASEVMIYDESGTHIYLRAGGIVEIVAATKVRMVTPRLEVTGDIIDNCDIRTETMANLRTIYDQHTHPVPNVQAGSATATTQIPTQQQL